MSSQQTEKGRYLFSQCIIKSLNLCPRMSWKSTVYLVRHIHGINHQGVLIRVQYNAAFYKWSETGKAYPRRRREKLSSICLVQFLLINLREWLLREWSFLSGGISPFELLHAIMLGISEPFASYKRRKDIVGHSNEYKISVI